MCLPRYHVQDTDMLLSAQQSVCSVELYSMSRKSEEIFLWVSEFISDSFKPLKT
jgi:hypothetical protein